MTTENCGIDFDLELYLKARAKTVQAVQSAAAHIHPGMNEAESLIILNHELNQAGVEKFWHPTKFRIGSNTIKSFRDISDETVLLENDLFFIDIGPVFFNHEGDYGETFLVGSDARLEKLQAAPKQIFYATQAQWKAHKLTGVQLYEFAEQEALKLNLVLNTKMYGHRLGDFPHALHFKGKLGSLEISPAPHLWVLEIHLIDESTNRGAFFEDILI
ncbi:MAG: M24 family metallopeptidase [Bacteriovorax sp.]|nr:M24 family metallopeptidase [Bacteriovorax sp.]